jgi:hypothetical protein
MSDRGRRLYSIRVEFLPDSARWDIRANSEEEAIEKFKEQYEQEILRNWIKYTAEEEEE